MKFRPCIDLHNGKVKQIVGSTFSDSHEERVTVNFQTDRPSSHFAKLYKKEGLTGGHVIMLGPGNEAAAKQALSAFPGGLQVGGGITPANAPVFLDAGASHVIVTSYVFKDGKIFWEHLKEIVQKTGKERLVLDISCRKKNNDYYIVTDRWQKFTDVTISKDTFAQLSSWCDEFLVHAVDVEGRQGGVDCALIRRLSRECPIPVTYAGGIRSLEDMETVYTEGSGRIDATIGSALDIFGGGLMFKDVVTWHWNHNR